MTDKKVFLLLNGETPKELPDMSSYDVVCATDEAYDFLNKHNIIPNFISGDFDSVKTIPETIEAIHTPNQNYTDFDKALQILFKRGYKNIHVFGASGKQQDHFLGNLNTALQWKSTLTLKFIDNHGFYFLADRYIKITSCKGKTISLIPLPLATKIKTKGLQYPLNNESLSFGDRIGTRNMAVEDTIEITFETGDLFVFIID